MANCVCCDVSPEGAPPGPNRNRPTIRWFRVVKRVRARVIVITMITMFVMIIMVFRV